jgi:hypothetical protein
MVDPHGGSIYRAAQDRLIRQAHLDSPQSIETPRFAAKIQTPKRRCRNGFGDAAAYADLRDRYRDMAKTLGFEGHIEWAEAMPRFGLPTLWSSFGR